MKNCTSKTNPYPRKRHFATCHLRGDRDGNGSGRRSNHFFAKIVQQAGGTAGLIIDQHFILSGSLTKGDRRAAAGDRHGLVDSSEYAQAKNKQPVWGIGLQAAPGKGDLPPGINDAGKVVQGLCMLRQWKDIGPKATAADATIGRAGSKVYIRRGAIIQRNIRDRLVTDIGNFHPVDRCFSRSFLIKIYPDHRRNLGIGNVDAHRLSRQIFGIINLVSASRDIMLNKSLMGTFFRIVVFTPDRNGPRSSIV